MELSAVEVDQLPSEPHQGDPRTWDDYTTLPTLEPLSSKGEVWIAMTLGPASTNRTTSASSPETHRRNAIGRVLAAHWLALALTVVAAVFIGQNRQRVSIDLFWARVTSPLWLTLVITALVGLFIGMLATRRRAKRAERR